MKRIRKSFEQDLTPSLINWLKQGLALLGMLAFLATGLFSLLLLFFIIVAFIDRPTPPARAYLLFPLPILLGGISYFAVTRLRKWRRNLPSLMPDRQLGNSRYAYLSPNAWHSSLVRHIGQNGVRLDFKTVGRTGAYRRVVLSIRVSSLPGEFFIEPESLVDKAAKWLGVSKEHQTGDAHFDHKLYLISDLPRGMESILRHSMIRLAVRNLLHLGFVHLKYVMAPCLRSVL